MTSGSRAAPRRTCRHSARPSWTSSRTSPTGALLRLSALARRSTSFTRRLSPARGLYRPVNHPMWMQDSLLDREIRESEHLPHVQLVGILDVIQVPEPLGRDRAGMHLRGQERPNLGERVMSKRVLLGHDIGAGVGDNEL